MASSDGPVRATADDAVVSKLSAAAAGYFDDPFVSRLAGLGSEPPPKRMPIINVSLGFFLFFLKIRSSIYVYTYARQIMYVYVVGFFFFGLARHVGSRGSNGPRRRRVFGGAVSGGGAERRGCRSGAAAANRLPRRGPRQPLLPPLAASSRRQRAVSVVARPAAAWRGPCREDRRGGRGAVARAATARRERQGPTTQSRTSVTPHNYS